MSRENFEKVFSNHKDAFTSFKKNKDHGLLHTFNVWIKAKEIASHFDEPVDQMSLYIMAICHDMGRFRLPTVDKDHPDFQKQIIRQDRSERAHAMYGVAQIRRAWLTLSKKEVLGQEWLERYNKIKHYIKNHDKMTWWLDPNDELPNSIEGQIVLLADRISTDASEEIERYWETGKRRKTTYFNPEISLQERIDFNFTKIGKYIQAGKLDQFMFFFAMLAISENDFEHQILKSIYKEWSARKYDQATETIYRLAREADYDEKAIEQMKNHINAYLEHYGVEFGWEITIKEENLFSSFFMPK